VWKVEKIISKGDYNYCVVSPTHPLATKHGYVLHHRIVMENELGRLLNANEVVHHVNHDKKDNRIENLEVLTASQHATLHAQEQGQSLVQLKCPQCMTIFTRRKGDTHLQKKSSWTSCSRSCRGKFSRKIQIHGLTTEVEAAISGNIVREYNSLDNPEETETNQNP